MRKHTFGYGIIIFLGYWSSPKYEYSITGMSESLNCTYAKYFPLGDHHNAYFVASISSEETKIIHNSLSL